MTVEVGIYDDTWRPKDVIHLIPDPIGSGVLTTDRAESSYGSPVLVVDGKVYGPAEVPKYWVIVAGPRPDDAAWGTIPADYLLSPEGQDILRTLADEWHRFIEAARRAGYQIRG